MFNSDTQNQYSLPSRTSSYYLKLWLHGRQIAQHISWSQGHSTSLHISKSILQTFTPGVNHAWQVYPSFNRLYKELLPGFQLVDNFADHFSFNTVNFKNTEVKNTHICTLNKIFDDFLLNTNTILLISDISIKNNVVTLISHICSSQNILTKTIHYAN